MFQPAYAVEKPAKKSSTNRAASPRLPNIEAAPIVQPVEPVAPEKIILPVVDSHSSAAKSAAQKSTQPELKITLGGRIQLDTRFHSYPEDSVLSDENNLDWFEFRRARLDVKAKYGKHVSGKISVELSETPFIKNAFIDAKLNDAAGLEMGKFTPAFNPEDVESSKYLTFLERSTIGKTLSSGDDHGIDFFGKTDPDYFVYRLGLVTGNIDQDTDNNTSLDWIGRVIFQPTADGDDFFKMWIGVSAQGGQEKTNEGDAIKIRPESNSGLSVFKASFDPDIEYDRTKFVLDLTTILGPTTWRAEYLQAQYTFEQAVSISGGFVSASVMLTGEARTIEEGYNQRQEIDSPTNEGGAGAWELALRYSWFDVAEDFFVANGLFTGWEAVSAEEYAGTGSAVTLALNWYPNSYVRVQTNWVTTFAEMDVTTGSTTTTTSSSVENAFITRVQLEFN